MPLKGLKGTKNKILRPIEIPRNQLELAPATMSKRSIIFVFGSTRFDSKIGPVWLFLSLNSLYKIILIAHYLITPKCYCFIFWELCVQCVSVSICMSVKRKN